jgi:hypothetical protein
MAGANAKLDKSLGQGHCDDCDTVNTPICKELAIASHRMTLLVNPMINEFFSHFAQVFVPAKQQLDVGFVQDAVDIPQFLFHLLPRCYPARFCEPSGTKGKPAISLRQRALFWLRESDLN